MTLAFQPHTLRLRGPLAPPPRPTCLNCKAFLAGKFCHDCGQSAKTPSRITVGAILHELPHAILHLEHALPHTIVALLTRPGHAMREYLAGKRVKTYSPFALLFLVSGFLGLAFLSLKLNDTSAFQVKSSGNDFGPKLTTALFKYQSWLRLAALPVMAIGPAVALRGRTGLRYGEMIVASAMTAAGSAMIDLVSAPLQWAARHHSVGWGVRVSLLLELVTTIYVIWAWAQLQNDGRRNDPVRRVLRAFGALFVTTAAWCAITTVGVVLGIAGTLALKHFHLL